MDREYIEKKILDIENKYNFTEGYKLLYCPWSTINHSSIAFISLNPGSKMPDEADMRLLSDERGNSYEVEMHTTKSPITNQFLELCKLLNKNPSDILTGTICPFRSKSWISLSREQRDAGLMLGKYFWHKTLDKINLLICVGNDVAKNIISISDFNKEKIFNSGWGDIKIIKYKDSKDRTLIHLPHLSTFKLLSRKECIPVLKEVFEL
tara:strand:+ start:1147 stop:1770 length:624 start_codon:yes stop_codon:yes gene_type:complete